MKLRQVVRSTHRFFPFRHIFCEISVKISKQTGIMIQHRKLQNPFKIPFVCVDVSV